MSISASTDGLIIKDCDGYTTAVLVNVIGQFAFNCSRYVMNYTADDIIALAEQVKYHKQHGHFKPSTTPLDWHDYQYCSVSGDYTVTRFPESYSARWRDDFITRTPTRHEAKEACQRHADRKVS